MVSLLNQVLIPGAGLTNLWTYILDNWLTPVYFACVAIFGIMFLKDRSPRKIISFVAVAAVVGLLVFSAQTFFGKSGSFQNVAKSAAGKINTVALPYQASSSDAFSGVVSAFDK